MSLRAWHFLLFESRKHIYKPRCQPSPFSFCLLPLFVAVLSAFCVRAKGFSCGLAAGYVMVGQGFCATQRIFKILALSVVSLSCFTLETVVCFCVNILHEL